MSGSRAGARAVHEPVEGIAAAPDAGRGEREVRWPGRQRPWRGALLEWRAGLRQPACICRSEGRRIPQPRCATGDDAAGQSGPTIVHAIEFLKIGALQHHRHGRRQWPVVDYLKPKVFSVAPSTRVTGLPEKNVAAYNSVRVRHFLHLLLPKNGPSRRHSEAPLTPSMLRI